MSSENSFLWFVGGWHSMFRRVNRLISEYGGESKAGGGGGGEEEGLGCLKSYFWR